MKSGSRTTADHLGQRHLRSARGVEMILVNLVILWCNGRLASEPDEGHLKRQWEERIR